MYIGRQAGRKIKSLVSVLLIARGRARAKN